MSEHTTKHELPKRIERYLAALSKHYELEGRRQLQEILVNAQIRVHEEAHYDNWNGGTYGHALYLTVPEPLFMRSIKSKLDIVMEISQDLNKLHNFPNEHISNVFLEVEDSSNTDWRKKSGLLAVGKRSVSIDATARIWENSGFRLFLSHKSEVKKETAELKVRLRSYGVSAFVAHEDIEPTQEWRDEIENALSSMDGFVALMTLGFHDSDWTDQEVGFAFARGVPIIAVRLGKDPYGFIGKLQALTTEWSLGAEEIVKLLIRNDTMFSAYLQALKNVPSFDVGNKIAKVLLSMNAMSEEQIDSLLVTYNNTRELQGCYALNGTWERKHGPGLVEHLHKFSSRRFRFTSDYQIESAS